LTTLLISQPNGADHITPQGHPERAARLEALAAAFAAPRFEKLARHDAPPADLALAENVHSAAMLADLRAAVPEDGIAQIESDTYLSPKSLEAAATALGAGLAGLASVMEGRAENCFCAVRPPGHHAGRDFSMGFCLINTIAIVAAEARRRYGVERIAIVDFDVHHGNGTQDIFAADRDTFYGSSHQMPLYPGTGRPDETGVGNLCNAPLPAFSGGIGMREVYRDLILPRLAEFRPDLMLVSAGFDAERRDPIGQLGWVPDDYAWLTGKLMDAAERFADNRLVSLLEGGYDLDGLAEAAASHVSMLMAGVAAAVAE